MDKISVIVPVYNVEKWIEKCVESIVKQTYENLEIILVNDGSKDRSLELCTALAEKDERIKVINKENGGLSSARNAGIEAATGDYIGFIDSDDYIASEMYETLHNALIVNQAEMAICSMKLVDEDGKLVDTMEASPLVDEVMDVKQAYAKLDADIEGYWYYVTAVNKLYHRDVFDTYRFVEGCVHEDEFAVHHLFSKCKKIVTCRKELYFYVQRENSITHSRNDRKRLDAVAAFIDRYYFLKNEKAREEAVKAIICAYGIMKKILMNKKNSAFKKEFRVLVKTISIKLLLHRKLRGMKLVYLYMIL